MCKKKVDDWLSGHREEQVEFLRRIIQIPSVTGQEKEIQDFISSYLQDMGLEVDYFIPSLEELRKHPAFVEPAQDYRDRPNVVAQWKGTGGGPSLLFNGHIDVVPEGPEESWIEPCWSAHIVDGKMYGRGTSDMKSGVAAMTMAIQAIKESGIRLKGDIISEYVMDEELTGNGTLACVMKGYKADAGICCETSSMGINPGSIGRIWWEITVQGKAAGIQRRFEGVNAIDLGYIVKQAVDAYEQQRVATISDPLYPDILSSIPCMVGQFQCGTYASAFPDSCVLTGSMATVPSEDNQAVMQDFIHFVQAYAAGHSDWLRDHPPLILFKGYYADPCAIPLDSPIVSALSRAYTEVMGDSPQLAGRQGAADIRHLVKYGNTPTVIFGPGLTEQMHANSEYVRIEDYLNAVRILAHTILEWCKIEEE